VELVHEVLEPRPVAVRALEHDAAALEQALQHELDLEPAFLVLLDTQRQVLEIDEHGDRLLFAQGRFGRHRQFLEWATRIVRANMGTAS
jgi:hypothetical protein